MARTLGRIATRDHSEPNFSTRLRRLTVAASRMAYTGRKRKMEGEESIVQILGE